MFVFFGVGKFLISQFAIFPFWNSSKLHPLIPLSGHQGTQLTHAPAALRCAAQCQCHSSNFSSQDLSSISNLDLSSSSPSACVVFLLLRLQPVQPATLPSPRTCLQVRALVPPPRIPVPPDAPWLLTSSLNACVQCPRLQILFFHVSGFWSPSQQCRCQSTRDFVSCCMCPTPRLRFQHPPCRVFKAPPHGCRRKRPPPSLVPHFSFHLSFIFFVLSLLILDFDLGLLAAVT